MENPLELLKERQSRLISARTHSLESYRKGEITLELHLTHLKNIVKYLHKYNNAIKILQEHDEK